MHSHKVKPADTLRLFWQTAKNYPVPLVKVYGLLPIAQIAENILSPLLIAGILTKLAQGNIAELSFQKVAPTIIAIVFLELFALFLANYAIRIFWRFEEDVMRDLSIKSFQHLSSMSYRFFSDRFSGSLVSQVNKFVGAFERFADVMTWNVYRLIVMIVAACVVLAPKAPIVVVAILLLTSMYVPLVWLFRKRLTPLNRKWSEAETKKNGLLADSISNILAIKAFSNESKEIARYKKKSDAVYNHSIKTMTKNMNQELVTGAIQVTLYVSVIGFSIWLATTGRIAVGIIYLCLDYIRTILMRLWDLNGTFRAITRLFGDANDMTEIFMISPEIADSTDAKKFTVTKGDLSFDNVTFTYPEAKEALFHNFNLHIEHGQKVGLVGHSGSGKTSITKLTLRFMDIQSGNITIDGHNIADMKQSDLRDAISYVPQEPLLFHRSIAENISYGKHQATLEEIKTAAKKAHAHEFIVDLPEGYDTLVGERGVKLSGGQKQRIAIARTFLKNAPIIVLDEATSALDSESEVLIQDALLRLMEGKTAIVIAHRLSTIQRMDSVIVLAHGSIAEQGTHEALLSNKGIYADLWKHQSGGFIKE
jgi:ATP-binding cassette subfamily B protein